MNCDAMSCDTTQVAALCLDWQKRLRLQDWNVRLKLVDEDLDEFGRATSSINCKEAVIRLRDPGTIPPDWLGCRDLEVTLVHELLHLHSRGFEEKLERKSLEFHTLETMIELTAIALVTARREGTAVVAPQ